MAPPPTSPFPFVFFLPLLVLLLVGCGFARALEYQTLVVKPLSRPPPVEAVDEEDLAWTVGSEELADLANVGAGAGPASVTLRLHHRDSLLSANATPEGIFSLRLERDAARVSSLEAAAAAAVSYGDGSITNGEFSTETLTFRGGARVGRVPFGCGHDNTGLFVAAAGLLGLGRGRLSFPSQAGRRFGRRFSYCLVGRTSAVPPRRRSSTVVFGNSAVPKSGVVFTPMVVNPRLDTFYYVELTGISVGGARVSGVLASDLRLDPATGRGGVIVDSGTSVTRLARPAYAALRDAFRAGAEGLTPAPGFSLFDTCYDLSGRTEVNVPTVVVHLGGARGDGATADLSLPAENYLIPVDTSGVFCFAFAGTDSGISIIGNIQQQGFRVVFDGAGTQVGFVPRAC
ncbi:hypothetical protein Taro_013281 [Colocasia esculenta]|uniref:Peptidase A1 domain-containing protein n=1 Tax=Colocasia esculenta TaxID=4460 RepID=A0A843UF50_COLES|nr:hypothetical protein [Colocasia esculenta]